MPALLPHHQISSSAVSASEAAGYGASAVFAASSCLEPANAASLVSCSQARGGGARMLSIVTAEHASSLLANPATHHKRPQVVDGLV